MLVKCICTNCAGHLEFEEENAGQKITCPHCRFETVLALPGEQAPSPAARQSLLSRPAVKRLVGGIALAAAGVAGVLYVLHRWGVPWLQEEFTSIESTTVAMVVLVLACLAVPFVLFWLVFPVVLSFQLWRLTNAVRRVNEVQESANAKAAPEPAAATGESTVGPVKPD